MNNSIHFVLQGKGGVGKSFGASLLAQYFKSTGRPLQCFDTDPVNQTLSQYSDLPVAHLPLEFEGQQRTGIDERKFDKLMEVLLGEDKTFVVDNGAATFLPLSNYLFENRALEMLSEAKKRVFIHSIITGGQALLDTLTGFDSWARNTPGKNIVVWQNEFFGPIEDSGKPFEEMKAFVANKAKVYGQVKLVSRNADTYGRDLQELTSAKISFDEALQGPTFNIMSRQRLKIVRDDVFTQLAALEF